ncbi:MAG: glycosyltransferase family 4 protein [Flaviflexus sp.]|nr:glycosyltransferase family 4 protein [Flaviflexus sp.]
MRIALISDCYTPRLGGIESQVRDLAIKLAGEGHEVILATATPAADGADREIDESVKVVRLDFPPARGVPVNPLAGPGLEVIMRGADVTHIHTGVISPFADHAALIAAAHRLPAVVTWHCMLWHWQWLFRLLRYRQFTGRRGLIHTTVSEMMARQIQGVMGDSAKVGVLYNGIELDDWRQVAAQRLATPRRPGPLRIVSSRRLARRKRNAALIELAVAAQAATGVDCELTIFGEGPERPALERLIERLDAPWVHLAGRVDRAGLAAAYADADIYFSTSLMDSFGIATLEGRTCGLPVVAPAHTGVDDFCEPGVGSLVGEGDADLQTALEIMLSDDELREAMSRHNATTLPSQDWSEVLPATLAYYRAAIDAQR